MPLPHVCPRCGESLTAIRAAWAPALGVPVTVCPTCRFACVRRKPDLLAMRRAVARAVAACFALVWRLAVPATLGLATFGIAGMLVAIERTFGWRSFVGRPLADIAADLDQEGFPPVQIIAATVLGVGVATGVLLAGMFGHLRRRWVWPVTYLAGLALAPMLFAAMELALGASQPFRFAEAAAKATEFYPRLSAAALLVALFGAPLGVPAGARLRRIAQGGERRNLARMLRRTRAARSKLRAG